MCGLAQPRCPERDDPPECFLEGVPNEREIAAAIEIARENGEQLGEPAPAIPSSRHV
jgi:hypothetical protein